MNHPAKLAYLTQPQAGMFVLNVQTEGQEGVTRYEITPDQLRGIVVEGTSMAFRARENDSAHQSIRFGAEKSGVSRQASPEQK